MQPFIIIRLVQGDTVTRKIGSFQDQSDQAINCLAIVKCPYGTEIRSPDSWLR